jgi:Domain of unknown function (DUF4386)
MVLFGSYNLLIGYLIFRSTFMPRILGVLLAISGSGYLINCFANFLSPAFAAHLLPYILVPGGADLLLALWLVVIGVNIQRWNEQASASRDGDRVISSCAGTTGHDRYYKRIDAQIMTSSPSSERLRDARPAYRTELRL